MKMMWRYVPALILNRHVMYCEQLRRLLCDSETHFRSYFPRHTRRVLPAARVENRTEHYRVSEDMLRILLVDVMVEGPTKLDNAPMRSEGPGATSGSVAVQPAVPRWL